jgi:hypothetical protein
MNRVARHEKNMQGKGCHQNKVNEKTDLLPLIQIMNPFTPKSIDEGKQEDNRKTDGVGEHIIILTEPIDRYELYLLTSGQGIDHVKQNEYDEECKIQMGLFCLLNVYQLF